MTTLTNTICVLTSTPLYRACGSCRRASKTSIDCRGTLSTGVWIAPRTTSGRWEGKGRTERGNVACTLYARGSAHLTGRNLGHVASIFNGSIEYVSVGMGS